MPGMNADQIIIETLKREGVKHWLGSTGEEQMSLLDTMYLDGSVKLFTAWASLSGAV